MEKILTAFEKGHRWCSALRWNIMALLLAMLLLVPAVSSPVFAQTSPDGSAANPYPIKTKGQLSSLAQRVNAGGEFYFDPADSTYKTTGDARYRIPNGADQTCFKLVADIKVNEGDVASCDGVKATGWTDWTPIGINGHRFNGTFDGDFHIVSGVFLKNNGNNGTGLFGATQNYAVIKNLGVANSYIANTGDNTGGIIGDALRGQVEKCFFSGTIVTSGNATGGIIGTMQSGTVVTSCFSRAFVTTTGSQVGGIVGKIGGGTPSCSINNVYSSSIINALYAFTGGVVGDNTHNNASLANCFFDKQMVNLRGYAPYDQSEGIATALETSNMTTGSWIPDTGFGNVTGGGYYPYIEGFSMNNNIVLSVVPLMLPSGATLSDLSSVNTVTLGGTSQNVTWTETERVGIGRLDGNTLHVTGQAYVVLKAAIGSQSWVYSLRFDKQPLLGTEQNPFTIDNLTDLSNFRDDINSGIGFTYKHFTVPALGANTHFLQTSDINMPNSGWMSVGYYEERPFKGVYDGGNLAVKYWRPNNQNTAFFRYTENATVRNLTVDSIRITENRASLIYSMRGGTVDNCHAKGSSNIKGGLIYETAMVDDTCFIKNSTNSNSFTAYRSSGIVASVGAKVNIIDNCHNYGNISGESSIGGIVSCNTLGSRSQTFITNCTNSGNITSLLGAADGACAGGILGVFRDGTCFIENCGNTGTITSDYEVAGIVGYTLSGVSVTVTKCYNTGTIVAAGNADSQGSYAYGIAHQNCMVSKCFNAGKVINYGTGHAFGISYQGQNTSDCFNAGEVYALQGNAFAISNSGSTNTYVIGRVKGNNPYKNSDYYDPTRVPMPNTGGSIAITRSALNNNELNLGANWEYEAGRYPRIKDLAHLSVSKAVSLPITFGVPTDNVDNVTADFTIAKDYGIDWRIGGTSGASIADQGTNAKLVTLPTDRTGGNIVLEAYVGDTVFYTIELKMGVPAPAGELTVENLDDLKALRDGINSGAAFSYKGAAVPASGLGATFKVTADFDFSPNENWKPIGTESNPFRGVFDGGNHTLSQMTCRDGVLAGLFGFVEGGTVRNLTLDKVDIYNCNYSAGVCAILRNSGTIRNCNVKGSVVGGRIAKDCYVYLSGIVAMARSGSRIVGCTNYADVSSSLGECSFTAGIVAHCQEFLVTVDTCVNAGTISLSRFTAGICAYLGVLNACVNYGEVAGVSQSLAVAGVSVNGSRATGCVNSGRVWVPNVSGTCRVAGVSAYSNPVCTGCVNAGYVSGSNASMVTGISDGVVSNCINVGQVTGTGAAVCAVSNSASANSFYDRQMCTATDGHATAKSTAEMCGSSLSASLSTGFTYEDNMYPRVAGIADLAPSLAIASPVFLGNNETVEMVESDFTMGGCAGHGVVWVTNNPASIAISSCDADVQSPGVHVLTAGTDSVYKKVYLNAKMDAFVIKDSLQLVKFRDCFNTWQDNTNFFYYNPLDSTFHARTDYAPGYVQVPMHGEGAIFRLAADIDLGGTEWIPIADYTQNNELTFKGTFDGGNHTISNFRFETITRNYRGLFGVASDAVFENIAIDNVVSQGTKTYVGGLCARMYGGRVVNATITNVSINVQAAGGSSYVGAMVGYASLVYLKNINVENCVVESDKYCVGGMAGNIAGGSVMDSCRVFKCEVRGNQQVGGVSGAMANSSTTECLHEYVWVDSCTVRGEMQVGGYSGYSSTTPGGTHRYIYVRGGSVTGNNQVGGLFGFAGKASIRYSLNSADVSGYDDVGGMVGRGRMGDISYCRNEGNVTGDNENTGGFVGIAEHGKQGTNTPVLNSVNTGHIRGNKRVGGIRGYSGLDDTRMGVNCCVNLGEVEGNMYVGGIFGESWVKCHNSVNAGQVHGANYVGGIVGKQTHNAASANISTQNCYSAGQVWGSEHVGNVAGAYDDGSLVNCYYDKQMSPDYKGVGTTGDDVTAGNAAVGKLTSEMLGSALQLGADFTYTAGLYPRPTTIMDSAGTLVAASPVDLPELAGTTVTAYTIPGQRTYDFTPSTANGVEWNRIGEALKKDGDRFVPDQAGRSVLVANIGNASKKLNFTVGASREFSCVIKNHEHLRKFTQFVNSGNKFYYKTSDSTFVGSEPEDLLTGVTIKPGGEDAFFKLGFDPDYSTGDIWQGCIGTALSPFLGDFNGDNHTVKDLTCNAGHDYNGFFGFNGGTIYGLNIEDAKFADASYDYVGILCGQNTGRISDCHLVNGVVNGNNHVGGLVGYNEGYVENSHNSAAVNGSNNVGGIAGSNWHTVRNCFNLGDVTATGSHLGGVAGNSDRTLTDCYNAGNVTAQGASSAYVGGVVGHETGATFANCYNAGQVVAPTLSSAGGVAGYSRSNSTVASLAYDIQMCSLPSGFGGSNGNVTAATSAAMTGTGLEGVLGTENWTYTANLYPRLTVIKDIEASVVSATPALLTPGENVTDVLHDFSVVTDNNVRWSVDSTGILDMSALPDVTLNRCGTPTLFAKLGDTGKEVKNIPLLVSYTANRLREDTVCGGSDYTWDVNNITYTSSRTVVFHTVEHGCQVVHTLNLVIPEELQLNINPTDERCYQANDGTATANVTGGFGQYRYEWKDANNQVVSTDATATGLAPGDYSVRVVDMKPVPEDGVFHCFVEGTVAIGAANELTFKLDTFYAGCHGAVNGMFQVSVDGGNPPYELSWKVDGTNGGTRSIYTTYAGYEVNGLPNGSYEVSITDANGCVKTLPDFNMGHDNTKYTISALSDAKTYDGLSKYYGHYILSIEGQGTQVVGRSGDPMLLPNGDTLAVAVSLDSLTDAGEYPNNVVSCRVTRGTDDVTCLYNLDINDGLVSIGKRPVTVTSLDSSDIVGRVNCVARHEVAVTGEGFLPADSALVTYSFTGQICSQYGGMVPNEFTINWNGVNRDNYDVTVKYGTLSLLAKNTIYVHAVGVEKTYDGVPVNVNQEINKSYHVEAYLVRLDVNGSGVNDTIRYTKGSAVNFTGASGVDYYMMVTMNNFHNFTVRDADTVENAVTRVIFRAVGLNNPLADITSEFQVVMDTALIQINPVEITLTSYDGEWTYDGQTHSRPEVSVTGGSFVAGELQSGPTATAQVKTQGSWPNTISYTLATGANPLNYKVTKNEGNLVILKRTLSLRGVDKSVDYQSGVVQSTDIFTYDNLVEGHAASGIQYLAEGEAVGNHTGVFSGSLTVRDTSTNEDVTENYQVNGIPGVLSIQSPNGLLTIKSGSQTREYDGTALTYHSYEVTYKGANIRHLENDPYRFRLSSGDTLEVVPTGTGSTGQQNAGSAKNEFTHQIHPAANHGLYTYLVGDTGTVTVTRRPVTLTSGSLTKTYDGTAISDNNVHVSGYLFVNGEGVENYTFDNPGNWTQKGTYPNAFGYTLNANTDPANYEITADTGTLVINAATLTVKADDQTRVYGDTNPAFTCTITGFQPGDDQSVINGLPVTCTTPAGQFYNTGTYSITPNTGNLTAANYTFEPENGELTVTKRELTVTVSIDTVEYDGNVHDQNNTPPRSITYSNLAAGDTVNSITLTYSRVGGGEENVTAGNCNIYHNESQGGWTVTNNYTVTVDNSSKLVITKKRLKITVNNATKIYDGTPLHPSSYTVDATDTLAPGDTIVNVFYTGSQTAVGSSTGSIDTNRMIISNPHVTFNVLRNSYELTLVDDTLTVTPRDLTIKLDTTKLYDGKVFECDYTASTGSFGINGLADGDTITAGKAITASDTVREYSLSTVPNGSTANNGIDITVPFETRNGIGNYQVIYAIRMVITKDTLPIVITSGDRSFDYDGTPHSYPSYTVTYNGSNVARLAGDSTMFVLPTGDTLAISNPASITYYSENAADNNTFDYTVGNPSCYDASAVTRKYGTISINAYSQAIRIASHGQTWTYDGDTHYHRQYTVKFDGTEITGNGQVSDTVFVLPTGDTLTITGAPGITDAGKLANTFAYSLQNDMLYIGPRDTVYDTLRVTPLAGVVVTVKERGAVTTYDGYEHSVHGYDLVSITDGNSLYNASYFSYTGSQDDSVASGRYAGSYQMNIRDTSFTNHNGNFGVSFVILHDSLVILKNPDVITITAGSAEKLYDGTPLIDSSYTYSPDTVLARGDTLVVRITGSVTEVGEADNVVAEYKVFRNETLNSSMIRRSLSAPAGYTRDVTDCYTFNTEMVKGKLTVHKALALAVDTVSGTLCPGETGYARLKVTGGKPADPKYQYSVSNGSTSTSHTTNDSVISLTGLNAATYTVTVTEALGNTATVTFEIKMRPALTAANSSLVCPPDIDDTIRHAGCSMKIRNIGTPTFSTTTGIPAGEITISNNAPADSVYPAGETVVRWVAKSLCGDSIYCEQKVKVSFLPCPDAVDFENTHYPAVRLGGSCKCWTAENLKSTRYSDGRTVENVMDYHSHEYPNTAGNVNVFGRLYDWYAAADTGRYGSVDSVERAYRAGNRIQGICPDGWYLPSDDEYDELNIYPTTDLRSTSHWINGANNTNSTGFNSLPGGKYNCATGRFEELLGNSYYWSCHPVYDKASGAMIDYICEKIVILSDARCNGYSVRCVYDEPTGTTAALPAVRTSAVSNIADTSASCGGEVTDDGGANVTARGVCWSTSPNPTIADSHTIDGNGMGSFTSNITGLTANTTYYARAYATNSEGTAYGNEVKFNTVVIDTNSCPEAKTITDHENNTYATVKIGNQCWMRQNLRTTKYANGTAITASGGSTSTSTPYYYDYTASNIDLKDRGLLYNWAAVMNGDTSSNAAPSGVQGICPDGWHVPSDAEWDTLKNYVSSKNEYICNNNSGNIAKALADTTGWQNYTGSVPCAVGNTKSDNNKTGFSAVPAGFYRGSSFNGAGVDASFWSSTQYDGGNAWRRGLGCNFASVGRYYYDKGVGHSVRCVKDNDAVIDEKSCPEAKTVTDVDNNAYATVKIGNQCWMRQNLRATKYADGTAIDEGWTTASSSTPYYYDYTASNIDLKDRGLLYNWSAATRNTPYNNVNVRGICPTGWHLPSAAEWDTLTTYVGSQSNYTCDNNSNNIAKALADTTGWQNFNTALCAVGNAKSDNNKTGFSAVPAGDCSGTSFNGEGAYADFWSSTQINSSHAYYRALYYYIASVDRNFTSKSYGYSVRCVKD